jgi:HEAT repeat protein
MVPQEFADSVNWNKIKREYKKQHSDYRQLQTDLLKVTSSSKAAEAEMLWSRLEEICTIEEYIQYLKTEPWAGTQHIKELFEPTSFYNRQDLARKLSEVADKRLITPFLHLLETEEDWFVKIQILKILGDLKEERSFDPLLSFLNDESPKISAEAALSLGKIGKPEALPYLLSYLEKQEYPFAQVQTLKALAKIRSEETLPLFREALKSSDLEVQIGAVEALGDFRNSKTLQLLIEFITKAKKEVRRKIIESLARFPAKVALPSILERLKDPAFEVRISACLGLANLRTDEALVPLSEMLMDSYSKNERFPVREAAEAAMKRIDGGKEFLAALKSDVVAPKSFEDMDYIEPETLVDEIGVTHPRLGALKSKVLRTYRNPANIVNPQLDPAFSEASTGNTGKILPVVPATPKKPVRVTKSITPPQGGGVQKTSKTAGIRKEDAKPPAEPDAQEKPKTPPIARQSSRTSRILKRRR